MTDEEIIDSVEPHAIKTMLSSPFLLCINGVLAMFTVGVNFVVWYLLIKSKKYELTNQRLVITSGILSKHVDEVELYKIKDTKSDQGLLERMAGIGQVVIIADKDFTLKGIPDPRVFREKVRNHSEKLKQERNVRVIE